MTDRLNTANVSESPDYTSEWEDYSRRVRWFFGSWLGGFAVVGLLAAVLGRLAIAGLVLTILAVAWIALFIVLAVRLQLFKCPRCRQKFFMAFSHYNPFARRCVHCGLPKWSRTDSCDPIL